MDNGFPNFHRILQVSTLSFHHPLAAAATETLHILFVNSCMKRVEIFSEMWSNKYFFSLFSFLPSTKKKMYVVDSIDYTEAEKRENEWFSCHLLQFATFLSACTWSAPVGAIKHWELFSVFVTHKRKFHFSTFCWSVTLNCENCVFFAAVYDILFFCCFTN